MFGMRHSVGCGGKERIWRKEAAENVIYGTFFLSSRLCSSHLSQQASDVHTLILCGRPISHCRNRYRSIDIKHMLSKSLQGHHSQEIAVSPGRKVCVEYIFLHIRHPYKSIHLSWATLNTFPVSNVHLHHPHSASYTAHSHPSAAA